MIPFEIDKVRVDHVQLRSVTTALGGSISIVDEERSTETKEVYKKIPVPLAIARAFIKEHEVRNYLKPALTAVTFYDNHAVALERHPRGSAGQEVTEGLFGQRHWVSNSEENIDRNLMMRTLSGNWFTDGTHVYRVTKQDEQNGIYLSADGRFRAVEVRSMKFATLAKDVRLFETEERTCLQFVAKNGQSAMTSPIWKHLGTIGDRQIDRTDADADDSIHRLIAKYQFDRVDQWLAVNLSFTLKAGREISKLFGFDAIEPLKLADLMVQLRTVNLPNVPRSIKQTYDVGLPFTHMIAWLIGLTTRANTLDNYIVLRSLLKHLTTKGIYRKGAFNKDAVYRSDHSGDDVKLMTLQEAAEKAERRQGPIGMASMRIGQRGVGLAGGLYDAD